MRRKIWITKNWELSATIFVWFEKPVWFPNEKHPQDRDSGHWSGKDGLLNSHAFSHDALKNLFKVSFRKKRGEGFIAERIISVARVAKCEKKFIIDKKGCK